MAIMFSELLGFLRDKGGGNSEGVVWQPSSRGLATQFIEHLHIYNTIKSIREPHISWLVATGLSKGAPKCLLNDFS